MDDSLLTDALRQQRKSLVSILERERASVAQSEKRLAELDEQLSPKDGKLFVLLDKVLPPRGYLSKTAGLYNEDGQSGPPPSAMTLALANFGRELKELTATILPYATTAASRGYDTSCVYATALQNLTLDNDAIWAREEALPQVPAPLLIRWPYFAVCAVLDRLYDGRPIARFWYLETVARIPYFGYSTMVKPCCPLSLPAPSLPPRFLL